MESLTEWGHQGEMSGFTRLRELIGFGDALIGRLRWADPRASKERNILLGEDDQAAPEYVKAAREHYSNSG